MNNKLQISLPQNQAAFALVQCKNPVSSLLYVYGTINNGSIDLSLAGEELGLNESEIKKGADCLLAYSICKLYQTEPAIPSAASEEIINLRNTDYGFAGICQVYESSKGKLMRPNEIQSLYDIYVGLNMSADMITLLIGFLNEKGKFSLRNVEKTAYEWHDSNISTYEAAEEYMNNKFLEKSNYKAILKLLGITGRDAVTDEKKYLDVWIEKKISQGLIALAYEKTIYNLNELRWPYINKIIMNWYEQGYKTPQDIKTGENKKTEISRTGSYNKTPKTAAALLLEEYNNMRHEREERSTLLIAKISAKSPEFVENQKKLRMVSQKIALSSVSGVDISKLREESSKLAAERDAILKDLNVTYDMINPKPKCSLCNDYGYIGSEMCSCFKERLKNYNK